MKIKLPTFYVFYFLALFLIGFGYIATTPIFEGFDETAHFSRIKELSRFPENAFKKESFIDQSVFEYEGPVSYSSGAPPYSSDFTYDNFFKDKKNIENYVAQYRTNEFSREFVPSSTSNWQIQHPPLYYLTSSIVYKISDPSSLLDHFVILRIFSYLLALTGIFFAMLAARRILNESSKKKFSSTNIGLLVYPLIFPMFFPEFARIGNDALCILINGLIMYLLSFQIKNKLDLKISFLVGCMLGLGLLTKSFFIPITIAILSLYLFIYIKKKDSVLLKHILAILFPVFLIGGFWFFNHLSMGTESVELNQKGGLLNGLNSHFSISSLLRGIVVPLVTFFWAGTWSLVRLPFILYIPLFFAALLIIFGFYRSTKNEIQKVISTLAIFIFSLIYLGLIWHVLVTMALGSVATSPGWYFHILMPFFLPLISLACSFLIQTKKLKIIFGFLITLCGLFHLIAIWSNLSLFSGCSFKGESKYFIFPNHTMCLDNISFVLNNLNILGYGYWGLLCFSFGILLYGYLCRHFFKFHYNE
jgi:hypothetical protein